MTDQVVTEDHAASAARAERGLGGGVALLLDALSPERRAELERDMTEVRLPPGAIVFEVGDVGDAMYIIQSGLVDVVTGGENSIRLVTLGPGETFGEQSLLTGRPRSATAVAQTGVTLWRLDHADFVVLLGNDSQFAQSVASLLSERLAATSRSGLRAHRGQTVMIQAPDRRRAAELGRGLVPVCARMLAEAPVVFAAGPAEAWDGAPLPSTAVVRPPGDLAGAAVRAVRDNTLVLLLCAEDAPRDLCQGADRVIFVDEAPSDHGRAPERATRKVTAEMDGELIEEIAREVCGRRIGIALGSGGIRGWAHAGVFDVLAKERIPVDFVSGASAGALAGALYLAGMPATDMLDLPAVARQVTLAGLKTYRPSLQAILSGRPFAEYLRMKLGRDSRIEDLSKPLVISTTDLDTREAVHLTKGPLPEAIVASASVNGVFPPVTIDGRRLVDGGASDAVPVQVLRDLGADIVIAVNVMKIGRGASGLYTSRFRVPMPGLLDTLMIGLDTVITQSAMKSCQLADIIIEPQAGEARWYEIIPARKYARAAAAATTAALPEIRRLLGTEVSVTAN